MFLLPSPELKQETKDPLTSLQVKKIGMDLSMAKQTQGGKLITTISPRQPDAINKHDSQHNSKTRKTGKYCKNG